MPTLTPTASDQLPDLLVSQVLTRMQEYQPIVLTICELNRGDADAGSFYITLRESEWVVNHLEPGEESCADFLPVGGQIMVDTYNDVFESDEINNSVDAQLMTLIPPPICTPTPTP